MKKFLLLSTSLTACTFFSPLAFANPENGVVSAGSAVINTGPSRVDIHQSSDRAVIDWRSFNIDKGETTEFHQPSASSLTVNRINDSNPSRILGNLKANGNVVLINQAGISFGKDAVVDVNSLVATTSDITNANAMAGKLQFDGVGHADSAVINEGTITAKEAGLIGLVAPRVENNGVINARLGKVHMASGDRFTVDLYGDGALTIAASDTLQEQLIANRGKINAEGGVVQLTAAAGTQLVSSIVQLDGEINTPSAVEQNGRIIISGHDDTAVSITGTLNADGTAGGNISVAAKNILQQGKISANGTNGQGGQVELNFKNVYFDSEASSVEAKGTGGNGGTITVKGKEGSRILASGKYDASSATAKGGKVQMTAKNGKVSLSAAKVNADGKTEGGTIHIGGEYQGGGTLDHALKTTVNGSTVLSADATDNGKGGQVIVWSDDRTEFSGSAYARGGVNGGNGGLIELSSKDTLGVAEAATTNAAARKSGYLAGQLLLDPKNITIASGGTDYSTSYFELLDPNPDANSNFGEWWSYNVLDNGNVIVRDHGDSLMATNSGAVYLFNGATGGLISTLTGSRAGDAVGSGDLVRLTNGNVVIVSSGWDNGATANVGAITFINTTTGLNGAVSSSNSFVGGYANQELEKVRVLTNGNYVILDRLFDAAGITDRGGAVWGNGTTGTTGVMSTANAMVGTQAGDNVGEDIVALQNGNYLLVSSGWNLGAIADVGAVTWMSGTAATVGTVTTGNSIYGGRASDMVGMGSWGDPQYIQMSNSNVLMISSNWQDATGMSVGAITLMSGTGITAGQISSANSLVGTTGGDFDYAGNDYIELDNGNFVLTIPSWDNGSALNAGAVIMRSMAGGLSGTISSANALVGTHGSDWVGGPPGDYTYLYKLQDDKFLIHSAEWGNGTETLVGAITWWDGDVALAGEVSALNSLVGSTTGDAIGSWGITVLNNGNYVVSSDAWDNGADSDVGAITWGNGSTGISGVVSDTNSLIGDDAGDMLSWVSGLESGNYLVSHKFWDSGTAEDVGAVTLVDGLTGRSGHILAADSITGAQTGDMVGSGGVFFVGSGDKFVVLSPEWNNGAISKSGAATWLRESDGTHGVVSTANSLYSSTADSFVGLEISFFDNGNYLIHSSGWDDGSVIDAGAITFVNGNTGIVGAVSATNSLVGSQDYDWVGSNAGWDTVHLPNGNMIVMNINWDNGALVDAGAATFFNKDTGVTGYLGKQNSVVGSYAGDQVGWEDWWDEAILDNGNYVLHSVFYDGGKGSVLVFDGTNGTFGELKDLNAFYGSNGSSIWPRYNWDGDFEDHVNGRYVFADTGSERIFSISRDIDNLSGFNSYGDMAGSDVTLSPDFITKTLNLGTSVTLQANNDITLNDDLIADNPSGNGGTLTFQAGRSILLNANIVTDNGDLNLLANQDLATGVVNAHRDAGAAIIQMGIGTSIDAGTGNVHIVLDDGTGKTNSGAGDIVLNDVTADTIFVQNKNSTGDVILNGGRLIASGTGDAITIVSARDFNNQGDDATLDAANGRWLVYSRDPTFNTLNGMQSDFHRYSCTYGGSCPTLGAGNGFLFSITPILTVTPDALTGISYGDAAPNLNGYGYTVSGYLGSDASDDNLTGTLNGTTTYTNGANAGGTYGISYSSGALISDMGYGFTYANNTTAFTVAKKDITAAFNTALTKVYGNANPVLSHANFTFTGLVGSDSGSLFTSVTPDYGVVDANTNVGVGYGVTATIGSTANYNVTNTPATTLSITPRALTVVTNNASKTLPAVDPVFTGSNNLTAHDAALISWAYAPVGYGGLDGVYTIDATATDPSSRLANYTRTNNYGSFTVHPAGFVPPVVTPQPETSMAMPDTVVYMSLGGYLRDAQAKPTENTVQQSPDQQTENDKEDGLYFVEADADDSDTNLKDADTGFIKIHPRLKAFLVNPFAMLVN